MDVFLIIPLAELGNLPIIDPVFENLTVTPSIITEAHEFKEIVVKGLIFNQLWRIRFYIIIIILINRWLHRHLHQQPAKYVHWLSKWNWHNQIHLRADPVPAYAEDGSSVGTIISEWFESQIPQYVADLPDQPPTFFYVLLRNLLGIFLSALADKLKAQSKSVKNHHLRGIFRTKLPNRLPKPL